MKKKVLFLTFFILSLFMFINKLEANENLCTIYKEYNNLTTRNYQISKINFDNILKVCTNKVCSYKLDNNMNRYMQNHEKRIINNISDESKKIEANLKGIKIDSIYFKECN